MRCKSSRIRRADIWAGMIVVAVAVGVPLLLRSPCGLDNASFCDLIIRPLRVISIPIELVAAPLLQVLGGWLGERKLGPEFTVAPRWVPVVLLAVHICLYAAYWLVFGIAVSAILHKIRVLFRDRKISALGP